MALEIFFSYSHKDEVLREELEKHLSLLKRQGLVTNWNDREIVAGQEWVGEIDKHINTADIILLLVSPDFMASSYCYSIEMKRAMERHEAGEAVIIPVILRAVDWRDAPFGKLEALPGDGKPIKGWKDRDKAFLDVTMGIRKIIEKGRATKQRTQDTSLGHRGIIGLLPLTDARTIPQRESTVREVYMQLTQPGVSALFLTGLDGVGKSTLAALVCNYARKQQLAGKGPFTADPIWIKIDPTITMIELAAALFKMLGRPLLDFGRFSPEHQAVTLFQALDKSSKPFLIVLDQFDHILDVQTGRVFADRPGLGEWLDALNSRRCRCRILITSRHFPRDFTPTCVNKYAVEDLDIADGIELMRKQGVDAPEVELRAAVLNCGGIPLALKLLVLDLNNRKLSLQAFLKDPKYTEFWKGNVARNLVDSIYTHHLDGLQRKLLIAFSIYREAVKLEAAQSILEGSTRLLNSQLFSALDVLLEQDLLQAFGEGLYQVRTLVDSYIQARLMESDEQFNVLTAHYRAAEYYLQQSDLFEPTEEEREDLKDVHHLIEAVWHLCQAEHWFEAYTLMYQKGLYKDLSLWGENEILLKLILLFLPVDKWRPGRSQEADIYNRLGMVYNLLGKKQEALKYYRKALDIVKEMGDRLGEGVTLRHMGRVYNALGEKKEALRYFERALSILKDEGERVEVAKTYERLGRVYNVLGQKEQARVAYEQALKIYDEENNAIGKGTILSYLGRVYSTLGQNEQGLRFCKQGLSILQGKRYRRGEGRAYDNLGRIYYALGQHDRAREAYGQALDVTRQIGDLGGEGIVLQGLGNVYITLGQKELAEKTYEQALSVLREVGDKWREGVVLSSLAGIYADLGQKEMAFKYYKEAISKHRRVENYAGEGTVLYNLGMFYLRQQAYELALACLLSASTIFEKGQFQDQNITQQGVGELRTKVGEEQFTALLEKVESQASQLVDEALIEES